MNKCLKCGQKIPFSKFIFLTNYSTITCEKCNTKLEVRNRIKNGLIGGISGAATALSVTGMAYIGEHYFNNLLLGIMIGIFLSIIIIGISYFISYKNTTFNIVSESII